MQLHHPEPFAARWRSRWIWFERPAIVTETATRPVQADPRDSIGMLRRTLHLADVPASVPARIWVDGRYVLCVNGSEVARGPVRSDPRMAHYDVVDLGEALHVGDNVITITARHFGAATSWWMPVPASYTLGAGSVVFEALVGDQWVVADRSWRASAGSAWTPVPVPGDVACLPLESFDARLHCHGWQLPDFDDADWSAAVEIMPMHTGAHGDPSPPSEPFGMLRPPVRVAFPGGERHQAALTGSVVVAGGTTCDDPVRQVLDDEAALVQRHPVSHGAVESGDAVAVAVDAAAARDADAADGVVIHSFDLGHIAAGTLELEVVDAVGGTVMDIAGAEHLDTDGRLVMLGQHAGLRYVCAGGARERFESFDNLGVRYLHASVRVPAGAAQPGLAVAVRDRHRPRPSGPSFACSDPALNRIHAIGLRTVDLCALDAYVDCPTREQRAWTGDSVVHQMVDLVANPDWSMARWHPQLAAASRPDGMLPMAAASDFTDDDRTIVPDWSLHWVRSVHNLYRYTGDRELIAGMLPSAERTLRWFESYLADDGLLHDVSGWLLLDWASVYSRGCSSILNALWARALEDVADMATWLGNAGTAAWATRRRQAVSDGFDVFWDERRGVYVDHVVDGIAQPVAAQHGGAAALAAGIVPAHRIPRVVDRLTDRSRLIRHSWVMDPVTVTGGSTGFVHLVTGYPEPDWDVDEQMVAAEPFFRYVVHDGLARAGRADLIADLCRDWQVFVDRGETTWPECWTGGTRCHGWSSTPTRDLVVHVLGVTPAEPGYGSVRVEPALGGLDWARATVPTPHGLLTVEAHADGRLDIDSPVPVVQPGS